LTKILNQSFDFNNKSHISDSIHIYLENFKSYSSLKVNMKAKWDLNSFIFSFYNSLTLVFAETDGRYYGGGVLELTPREFKKLPIPYNLNSINNLG
jgi:hypothetical protein